MPPSLSSSVTPAEWWYGACGLRVRSELAVPGFASAQPTADPDVTVRRGTVEAPERWPASGVAAWPAPEADVISWAGRAKLRLTATEMVVDSDHEPFARQCVVGPGLGVVLHRRGRLVLHGSAVEVGGRAVVLLGQKGAGKSTTAAALLARGHRLLTDDLVAVDFDGGGWPQCAPGPVQMKLWPESAEALGLGTEIRPFVEGLEKGVWFGAQVAPDPAPVALVCSLAWGTALRLSPLAGAPAFGAVFEHAYAPRFLGAAAGSGLVAPTVRLCERARVLRVERPQRLAEIDGAIDQLEDALRRGAPDGGRDQEPGAGGAAGGFGRTA